MATGTTSITEGASGDSCMGFSRSERVIMPTIQLHSSTMGRWRRPMVRNRV